MRPSNRLDVWIVPQSPTYTPKDKDIASFIQRIAQLEMRSPVGSTAHGSGIQEYFGGFGHFRVVRETDVRFVANQQGGFRVFCNGENVTQPFTCAMKRWRAGGARSMVCSGSDTVYPLEALEFRPDAAFYTFALHFSDVVHCNLGENAKVVIGELLGSSKLVFRRIG